MQKASDFLARAWAVIRAFFAILGAIGAVAAGGYLLFRRSSGGIVQPVEQLQRDNQSAIEAAGKQQQSNVRTIQSAEQVQSDNKRTLAKLEEAINNFHRVRSGNSS